MSTKEETHHHHHHKEEEVKKQLLSVSRAIQNVGNSLYLQSNVTLGSSSVSWTTSPKSGIVALCNPQDTAAAGPIYSFLSGDYRLGQVCTKSYCGSQELWIQTYNSPTNTYTLQNFKWNLYLACGSNGSLVLTNALNNASRWTPISNGGNILFQNYSYTSYYLRGSLDGVTATANASSNPSADNLCNWFIDSTRNILINISSNILNSNNTVFETDTSYVVSMVFALIPLDGGYWALQTYFGGFLNANPDNLTISEFPYTDPGRLPSSAIWNLI